ncbi:hypothetical protein PDESU_01688 [Pontiella desulfatans]|uniref:Uncharacterized protein n=1 Tax=Pontiella desulfatans TaxID=2750659 RepID=A0A6C2U093_PONDE|nr:hypothetical protein [Pontiella desulfatans]VGO13134.1 hypothetical protein PDESU_01688 [Pontiella desulfatans]
MCSAFLYSVGSVAAFRAGGGCRGSSLLDDVNNWPVAASNVPTDAVSNETSHEVEDAALENGFFRVELLP